MKKNIVENILLITPFAPPALGGAETHLEDLYEYLRNSGYKTTLLTYKPLVGKIQAPSVETKKNLTIYRFGWFGNNLFSRFEAYPPIVNFLYITPYLLLQSIWHLLQHNKYDVIHVFGLNCAFIGRILTFFFHKPLVVSMEALYDFKPQTLFGRVVKWVFDGCDAILVGSEESRDDVLKLGIDQEKIIVYVHWIRLDNFKPGNKKRLKKQLKWKDEFTVLFVGRLIEIKGIRVFIETAKRADKKIQFKIIGDKGPELDYVEKWSKTMPNVSYLGAIKNSRIGTYFAAADVYVYPALYNEDLARVLIESLATGTPVINTNKGSGIYSLNESVGFVVKPDPSAIAKKIEFLYKNPARAKQMSESSIVFAQQFGPKLGRIIANTYEKVYKDNL